MCNNSCNVCPPTCLENAPEGPNKIPKFNSTYVGYAKNHYPKNKQQWSAERWQVRKWDAMTHAPVAQARNTNIAAGGKFYC